MLKFLPAEQGMNSGVTGNILWLTKAFWLDLGPAPQKEIDRKAGQKPTTGKQQALGKNALLTLCYMFKYSNWPLACSVHIHSQVLLLAWARETLFTT